jgi:2'-5' RNA ligase
MKLRLFSAIDLPPEVKGRLAAALDEFAAAVPARTVRWVKPEGMHLTLRFYGEVAPDVQGPIEASLRAVAAKHGPFRLGIEGLGVFPQLRQPRVVWAGVTGQLEQLTPLQADVELAAHALGFRPEARPFQAHMTLGRVNANVTPGNLQRLVEFIKTARLASAGEFEAGNLTLFRSEKRAGGSRYTALLTAPLLGQAAAPPASMGPDYR